MEDLRLSKIYRFDVESRITMLNERAKRGERKIKDLKIGESCYLISLLNLLNLLTVGILGISGFSLVLAMAAFSIL